jgi:hypothetical protein
MSSWQGNARYASSLITSQSFGDCSIARIVEAVDANTRRIFRQGSRAMKCSKRSFAVVSVLFALLLSLSVPALNARDADRLSHLRGGSDS